MLLSRQPGDTGIYATATTDQVRLYYVLDRVLPFVADKAAGVLSDGGGTVITGQHLDEVRVAQRIAAAPACVPREHLRMLYRLTATGTGASRTGGTLPEVKSTAAMASPAYPTAMHATDPLARHLHADALGVLRWGSPLIPFHMVQCSVAPGAAVSGSDSARHTGTHGINTSYAMNTTTINNTLSQEWTTPRVTNGEDGGVLMESTAHYTTFTGGEALVGVPPINGTVYPSGGSGLTSVTRNGRFVDSARGAFTTSPTAAAPTAFSLSCATDCVLFFLASNDGRSWVGRSDAATLSPLRVSTSLRMHHHGRAAPEANGGSRRTGRGEAGTGASSSSPRPPRPFAVSGNASFPTHSFASSEHVATPPNTVTDDAASPAAALTDSDTDTDSDCDCDDDGDTVRAAGRTGTSRRVSSTGPARPSSVDGLEAFSGAPSTMTTLPAGRSFSRHDRVVTASGWDPRNSAILALGRQGGVVQLLDVEYMAGSAASTRCSSTTSSAATDDTAEPFNTSANGAARTATSGGGGGHAGGPTLTPYSGVDHLSYSVIQQREMVGPVTALDWMPQSHLTVVAARRRDGLGCYAELLDLRASHDGVTYLGAPPEVFGVPVYARGAENAAPSVLCSAECVACHPSQRYVATVGTARMRDIVQLWDVRMATRPVAYQVYARAGYTSLCWSAAETGVVLGTTRDGGLRAHSFKELATRAVTATSGAARTNANAAGDGGGGLIRFSGASHRNRRRRSMSSGPPPYFAGRGGEQEGVPERWGAGHPGNSSNNNNSGYSGTEAEAEDDVLDDSGSFRSGVSVDGAGTALSSTTEGSNALVHVSVKAQSALRCRLPSRVPAAAVAWVCRPATALPAAAEDQMVRLPGSPPLPARADGNGGAVVAAAAGAARRGLRGAGSEDGWDGTGGDEAMAKAVRVRGVMERGFRTDLPQLLLLNSKNGELYTQVYNPRGTIVTILNQNMGLVGAGPNAFIVKASTAYKTAMHAHEEWLMQQLERQAVLAAVAADVGAAKGTASGLSSTSATPPAAGSTTALNASSTGAAGGGGVGGGVVEGGGGTAVNTPTAAPARRLQDHPVDLMGLGLLDEDDEEEEEEDVGSDGPNGSGPGEHRTAGATSGGAANQPTHDDDSSGGDAAAAESSRAAVVSPGAPPRGGGQSSARDAPPSVAAVPARHEALPTTRVAPPSRRGTPPPTERRGVGPSSLSRPLSPLVEGGGDVAAASLRRVAVPPELGYCQFHRVERVRLVWHRLRAGFSCNPIRNLRVLLREGVDREAYTAFLYGCCASMLLYPSCVAKPVASQEQADVAAGAVASDSDSPLPLILGARRTVPGLLELLVSERRLRAQMGLRDTRLSSRFRLRQHHATVPCATSITTEAGTAAGSTGAALLPPPAARGNPLGFVPPLLAGLPSTADRPHKGPPGFFRSPFDGATATVRGTGGRLPSPSPLAAATGGGGAAAGWWDAAAAKPASSDRSGGPAGVEQPMYAAAVGMLHQLILQSMGWLAPPSLCHVDQSGRPTGGSGGAAEAADEPHHGGAEAGETGVSPRPTSRHPPRHLVEKFFVQGDGLGQPTLQEALERRVTVLVLLDRLEEAAELLSLHSTHNVQYPSIALTLSAARGQTSVLLSLAAPESRGVTFWMHLLLTYVELLTARQSRSASATKAAPASSTSATGCCTDDPHTTSTPDTNPSPHDKDDGVATPATTRFDRLFTLAEQRAVVLRLLRGYPRLTMSDKVGLAAALLVPSHYHGGHVDNLVAVLQTLVHHQYRACTGLSTATSNTTGNQSDSGTVTPATSHPPPAVVAAMQRRAEGRRVLPSPVATPPPRTPATQPPAAASTPLAPLIDPHPLNRCDATVSCRGKASSCTAGGFAPVCGCSLLLVTAVEAVSTDCRALQRYVDECGDTQTALCYSAVFGNVAASTFRLWREGYRGQLNGQGLSMWRSQLDLQCVQLLQAREAAEKATEAGDGRAGGGNGTTGAVTGIAFDAQDHYSGGGIGPRVVGVVGGGESGISGAAAAAVLLHSTVSAAKGFPTALGSLGSDVGTAPTPSAAAMMSTQTAMMMKRTLKGFAQTTATSTAERDRTMREAASTASTSTSGLRSTDDVHRTIELRCNCGQAMHATAPGKSSISSMVTTNLARKQLIPCGNPECRQWQTPMCTVCGERMELRATELPPERFFAWCSVCLHGGHWCHLREWFCKHTKCAVENCPCHCCDNTHLS